MSGRAPGSGDGSTTKQGRTVSRFYRRPVGLAWLVGLALIPLLLAVIGYGIADRSRSQAGGEPGPGSAAPTLTEPTLAPMAPAGLAPVSIARHGDEVILEGNLPSDIARRTLLDSVMAAMDDVNIIDNLGVNPNIKTLDFSTAGPVFEAAAAIPDFSVAASGETVTLAGTAATAEQLDAVAAAAEEAWPNVNIVNRLAVIGPVTPNVAPGAALLPGHPDRIVPS
ncbi:MAG TPA: BON domain-containing protein [Mycobacterium sp.]|nr:BON domain-containing protein [Mycobacterium sp.]